MTAGSAVAIAEALELVAAAGPVELFVAVDAAFWWSAFWVNYQYYSMWWR